MSELFQKRMNMKTNGKNVGNAFLKQSNVIMDSTFTRDRNYKLAKLYGRDGVFLEDVDLKFQQTTNYTISKDQIEYLVQFRPDFYPEVKYMDSDNIERLGFYLDIEDATGNIHKWMIVGKDDRNAFVRYNILECNDTFKWIVNGVIHQCVGVLRSRNNYNSGLWTSQFSTTVQNQAMFIVPTTDSTRTIDYEYRFMISDNKLHPKVYKVSKIEDTYPKGVNKIVLAQTHFDAVRDNVDLMICDYFDDAILPTEDGNLIKDCEIKCSGTNQYLSIGGSARTLTATILDEENHELDTEVTWTFTYNGLNETIETLSDRFTIAQLSNKQIKISALDNFALIGKLLIVGISDVNNICHSSIELEVKS